MTTVKEIMSTSLRTLAPNSSLGEAIELLAKHKCSGAPVVSNGSVVGMITELELFDVLFDPALRDSPVSEFMTSQVWTVADEDSLGHAAHMFALYGIRRLPVLRDGKLVGLVSRRDVLLSVLCNNPSACETMAGFIPFLDEPTADGTNQEEFLLDCPT
ncbi:CBS domain-containing protein [Bythopirellula polymerisocia]|uniref:Inosine-5'-monophosphate dehydrogenase n=1 Tax=Bythopirellula polymerisocia TaxID=2528003 RepID=A0A5C6CH65_9BACT|nr:CBS domain-containing protein [Bythopirellula polymerisocia]TWU22621.1 Inosine-5'-monophosphate dehydrogenase [Bythopirellula polymerisocia]